MNSTRTRHEAQIKHYDTTFGGEFEAAIREMASSKRLSWFTDEQIADIREVMLKAEWRRRCLTNEIRASNAARRQSRMPRMEAAE